MYLHTSVSEPFSAFIFDFLQSPQYNANFGSACFQCQKLNIECVFDITEFNLIIFKGMILREIANHQRAITIEVIVSEDLHLFPRTFSFLC